VTTVTLTLPVAMARDLARAADVAGAATNEDFAQEVLRLALRTVVGHRGKSTMAKKNRHQDATLINIDTLKAQVAALQKQIAELRRLVKGLQLAARGR
jgi:hypothetical protein